MILGALASNSSESYWMVFHQSGSCRSSEAYWMVFHRSGSCKSGEAYREGFVPAKVEVNGLFFGAALFLGGKHEAATSQSIHC